MSERVRAYIYRALNNVIPAAIAAGYLTDKQSVWLLALVAALLGTNLAADNTSTKKIEEK